jgi:RNA polymerase sigma-70 factor (ECF subfamily)
MKQMKSIDVQTRFQGLVDDHRKILFKIGCAYGRNHADREDLAQEMILQLWRSFARFDGRCRFSTWMYRICLNVAISHSRRERTRARHVCSAGDHLLEGVEELDRPSDATQQLTEFIQSLDPLNRALLLLYLDGNSYRDIAEVLGISETNVATKLSRLKNRMKHELVLVADD